MYQGFEEILSLELHANKLKCQQKGEANLQTILISSLILLI